MSWGWKIFGVVPLVSEFGKFAKNGTKLLSQVSNSTIDTAVDYAMKGAKAEHLFDVKHNLSPLIKQLGGEENMVKAVLNSTNGLLPTNAVFKNILFSRLILGLVYILQLTLRNFILVIRL